MALGLRVYRPAEQPCLSFNRKFCPALNLSHYDSQEQKAMQKACRRFVSLERDFGKEARFCGKRAPRLNPCWEESGSMYCLPHFFILGEMKCGTTTLYELLLKHPRIQPPKTKEPRFLQAGRFPVTNIARYAYEFSAAADATNDAVSFDASPVYLRSPTARFFIAKWLPEAKLIVLVRDPVQRTYSHWKMGFDWLKAKCTTEVEKGHVLAMAPFTTFDAITKRSLMSVYMTKCKMLLRISSPGSGQSFQFWEWPSANNTLNMRLANCLAAQNKNLTKETLPELNEQYPTSADRRKIMRSSMPVMQCSEMMLMPPSMLTKGAMYSTELERWAHIFTNKQLLVIDTDDLTRKPQQQMNETFEFLGLPNVNVGAKTKFCVRGKEGIMDVLHEKEKGIFFEDEDEKGNASSGDHEVRKGHIKVGDCDQNSDNVGMHTENGVAKHNISPALEQQMRDFFKPYNQRLYRFLGRDLGWD